VNTHFRIVAGVDWKYSDDDIIHGHFKSKYKHDAASKNLNLLTIGNLNYIRNSSAL
jgi:hypothetical protein